MYFIVIGRDGMDAEAPNRRQAARAAHLALGEQMQQTKQQLMAIALLNDAGAPCGSLLLCNFETRAALDAWLATEPYVTGKVWANIEITEGRIAPAFLPTLERIMEA
jgi:uncharacterized protein